MIQRWREVRPRPGRRARLLVDQRGHGAGAVRVATGCRLGVLGRARRDGFGASPGRLRAGSDRRCRVHLVAADRDRLGRGVVGVSGGHRAPRLSAGPADQSRDPPASRSAGPSRTVGLPWPTHSTSRPPSTRTTSIFTGPTWMTSTPTRRRPGWSICSTSGPAPGCSTCRADTAGSPTGWPRPGWWWSAWTPTPTSWPRPGRTLPPSGSRSTTGRATSGGSRWTAGFDAALCWAIPSGTSATRTTVAVLAGVPPGAPDPAEPSLVEALHHDGFVAPLHRGSGRHAGRAGRRRRWSTSPPSTR